MLTFGSNLYAIAKGSLPLLVLAPIAGFRFYSQILRANQIYSVTPTVSMSIYPGGG